MLLLAQVPRLPVLGARKETAGASRRRGEWEDEGHLSAICSPFSKWSTGVRMRGLRGPLFLRSSEVMVIERMRVQA